MSSLIKRATVPAELGPGVQVLAFLIEDLDPVVPIGDEQATRRIHGHGVGLAELTKVSPRAAPFEEVLAIGVVFHDAIVVPRAVPVCDEDAAVGAASTSFGAWKT